MTTKFERDKEVVRVFDGEEQLALSIANVDSHLLLSINGWLQRIATALEHPPVTIELDKAKEEKSPVTDERAQTIRELLKLRPRPKPKMSQGTQLSDELAMNRIRNLLSGKEWDPDTLDTIAAVVRLTGREIKEPEEGGM